MADKEELTRKAINAYMDCNQAFSQDLIHLSQLLTEDKQIVQFCHELNCEVLDEETKLYLIEDNYHFCELFDKCLRNVTKEKLKDKKIWLFIKFKNLPDSVNVKNFRDLDQMPRDTTLFTIDSLQIYSLSNNFRQVYGRKFVAKGSEDVGQRIKWWTVQMHDQNHGTFSDKYYESKKDAQYCDGRKFMARIGSDFTERSRPIEVHIYSNTLSEEEVNSVYNGSHLENVVLYKSPLFGLTVLSFEKTLRPIPRIILASEFKQYLMQFPEEVQELYHVLVVCDDTLMVRRLFEWSSFMIEHRFLHKSLSVPMTGVSRTACQDDKTWLTWVDAGSLQYGADGVTVIECVDNLNELPEKERTSLFHALVTNEVIAKHSQAFQPMLRDYELMSTVWAVIEDDINEKQAKCSRGQNILWLEVFGMAYVVPQPPKGYFYCKLLGKEEGTMSLDTWQKTIQLMSEIDPQMEETSERLITQYYMASRRVRGSKMNHMSVETLTSLSKSFAKLSLRLTVTELDAVMAILLYEESMVARFPSIPSQMVVTPLVHVLPEFIDEVIGTNVTQL